MCVAGTPLAAGAQWPGASRLNRRKAGIGKSRLTQGLREGIAEPHAALNYQCSPYHLNSPLQPFIEQFELSAGFARDDASGRRLDKLEAAIAGGGVGTAEAAPRYSRPCSRYPQSAIRL